MNSLLNFVFFSYRKKVISKHLTLTLICVLITYNLQLTIVIFIKEGLLHQALYINSTNLFFKKNSISFFRKPHGNILK